MANTEKNIIQKHLKSRLNLGEADGGNQTNSNVPGISNTKTAQNKSKEQNQEYYDEVGDKMEDYEADTVEYDDNEDFDPPKRELSDNEEEYVQDVERGYGLQDYFFDNEPTDNYKDRAEKALKGDSTMGNEVYTGEDNGNTEPTWGVSGDYGEKEAERVGRRKKKKEDDTQTIVQFGDDIELSDDEPRIKNKSTAIGESIGDKEIDELLETADKNIKTLINETEADRGAAQELLLFIENDEELYNYCKEEDDPERIFKVALRAYKEREADLHYDDEESMYYSFRSLYDERHQEEMETPPDGEEKEPVEDDMEETTTAAGSAGSYVQPKVWAKDQSEMRHGQEPFYQGGQMAQSFKNNTSESKETTNNTITENKNPTKMKRLRFKKPFNGVDNARKMIPESYKIDNAKFEMTDGNERYKVRWEGDKKNGKPVILEGENRQKVNEDTKRMKNLMGYDPKERFENPIKGEKKVEESHGKFNEMLDKTKKVIEEEKKKSEKIESYNQLDGKLKKKDVPRLSENLLKDLGTKMAKNMAKGKKENLVESVKSNPINEKLFEGVVKEGMTYSELKNLVENKVKEATGFNPDDWYSDEDEKEKPDYMKGGRGEKDSEKGSPEIDEDNESLDDMPNKLSAYRDEEEGEESGSDVSVDDFDYDVAKKGKGDDDIDEDHETGGGGSEDFDRVKKQYEEGLITPDEAVGQLTSAGLSNRAALKAVANWEEGTGRSDEEPFSPELDEQHGGHDPSAGAGEGAKVVFDAIHDWVKQYDKETVKKALKTAYGELQNLGKSASGGIRHGESYEPQQMREFNQIMKEEFGVELDEQHGGHDPSSGAGEGGKAIYDKISDLLKQFDRETVMQALKKGYAELEKLGAAASGGIRHGESYEADKKK